MESPFKNEPQEVLKLRSEKEREFLVEVSKEIAVTFNALASDFLSHDKNVTLKTTQGMIGNAKKLFDIFEEGYVQHRDKIIDAELKNVEDSMEALMRQKEHILSKKHYS